MGLSTDNLSVLSNHELIEKEREEELARLRQKYDALIAVATVCSLALDGFLRARGYTDALEFHAQLKANWELVLATLS